MVWSRSKQRISAFCGDVQTQKVRCRNEREAISSAGYMYTYFLLQVKHKLELGELGICKIEHNKRGSGIEYPVDI